MKEGRTCFLTACHPPVVVCHWPLTARSSCDLDLLDGNLDQLWCHLYSHGSLTNHFARRHRHDWTKQKRKPRVSGFYWQKQYPNSYSCYPSSPHSREKTGIMCIPLPWMPQTLRPVQACVITHSFVNNKGTNWQNYRLDFPVKWPAEITKLSSQVHQVLIMCC